MNSKNKGTLINNGLLGNLVYDGTDSGEYYSWGELLLGEGMSEAGIMIAYRIPGSSS